MKKAICVFLLIIFGLHLCALADINVTISDSDRNLISVSGNADGTDTVMVYILSAGSNLQDFADAKDGCVIYAIDVPSDGKNFNAETPMPTGVYGDDFMVIAAYNGKYETKTFSFYPNDYKKSYLENISVQDIGQDNISEIALIFGSSDFGITENSALKNAADILKKSLESYGGIPVTNEGEPDISGFGKYASQAVGIAAIASGSEECFDDKDYILIAEAVGLSDSDEYEDYVKMLNSQGVSNVKAKLCSATYASTGEFFDVFSESVYVNVMTNYHMMGYAHVEDYLSKYSRAYTNAGFDITGFNTLSSYDKDNILKTVATSGAKSLSELSRDFNNAVNRASAGGSSSSGKGSSSGGGGSASMGGSLAPGYIEPVGDLPNSENTSSKEFSDVKSDYWAYEYIMLMAQSGVINGYSDGSFMPERQVTRAELTKMAVFAMGLDTANAQCPFDDAKDSWSAPFVGAAVKAGIVNGISETLFAPDTFVTREQAATIIARACKLDETTVYEPFDDDSLISDYAKGYVYALKAEGKLNGRGDNRFEPGEGITRAEVVKLIATCLVKNQ